MKAKQLWCRYRLKTYSVDDSRPLIFNPKYPCWESGFTDEYAVMIAYLPKGEDVFKYWDDAFDIEVTEHESIKFSDRFPKPDHFIES